MERRHYSKELKERAIQMYLAGKSSGKIAEELNLPSPDLVRKWVQIWRKENNISTSNYRRSDIAEEVEGNLKLLNTIEKTVRERDLAIQALKLICTGKIEGWEELLSYVKNKN